MTDLAYADVRPVLAKIADLDRELVLVGGQAVNFWASYYEARVLELAREAPFTSKDIDFCGDQRSVRLCAERLGGTARVATFDDATPNSGTVVFVDRAGETRTLDIVSAPFGLDAAEVHATSVPVEILDDAGAWIAAERKVNAVHAGFHPERWERLRHYLLLFHDDVFECLAESHECELLESSFGAGLELLARRVVGATSAPTGVHHDV